MVARRGARGRRKSKGDVIFDGDGDDDDDDDCNSGDVVL